MRDKIGYGFFTLLIWNVLLIVLSVVFLQIKDLSVMDVLGSMIPLHKVIFFFLFWSVVWFVIGYFARVKYTSIRRYHLQNAPLFDESDINKVFWNFFVARVSRIFSFVLLTSIPWYILCFAGDELVKPDYINIFIMFALSVLSYWLYKLKRNR